MFDTPAQTEHLSRETSRGHLKQMSEPPQLAVLNVNINQELPLSASLSLHHDKLSQRPHHCRRRTDLPVDLVVLLALLMNKTHRYLNPPPEAESLHQPEGDWMSFFLAENYVHVMLRIDTGTLQLMTTNVALSFLMLQGCE